MDIFATRVIPVIVINDPEDAQPLGEALVAGGLPIIEVTFRTPAAAECIAIMSEIEGLTVGAGTIVEPAQVELAVEAGAKFLLSPGLRTDVVREARLAGRPIVPGAVTPSEIMTAQELGVEVVHFFPANVYGGAPTLGALATLFPTMRFLPAGGLNASTIMDYLELPSVAAVGGSWVAPADMIDAHEFAGITGLCRQAVNIVASVA